MAEPIFTVGHSNLGAEVFRGILARHRIDVVVDVRASPASKYSPQFTREQLKRDLNGAGRMYLPLGHLLGGRPRDLSCYGQDGRVIYAELARTPGFKDGLARILKGRQDYRVALMCSESKPWECHRMLCLGRELVREGLGSAEVQHILRDGVAWDQGECESRMCSALGLSQALLPGIADRTEEAYRLSEERFPYRLPVPR